MSCADGRGFVFPIPSTRSREWCSTSSGVLRTGGARGIGRATARLLAQRGSAVCVNYVAHADLAERLAAEIMAAGGRAIAAMADVAESATVEMMVARAEKELGPVTILVNNAGVSRRRGSADGRLADKTGLLPAFVVATFIFLGLSTSSHMAISCITRRGGIHDFRERISAIGRSLAFLRGWAI
jgi:NAD(P)-dependent dehydrogenase (short-subunit alcohol dehydrogenase family)